MIGPGKYGQISEEICQRLQARGVILLVLDGNQGHGLSSSFDFDVALRTPELIAQLPAMLRRVADSVEKDINARGV